MNGLIIAAGKGSRLWDKANSKPLIPILGMPLIERVMRLAAQAGVSDFTVVTGYDGKRIRKFLDDLSIRRDFRISHVINDEWELGNGLSVLKARDSVPEPFVLLMSDHLFDPESLRLLLRYPPAAGEITLAVDRKLTNPLVDLDDVTRVYCEQGRVLDIRKRLTGHNGYDTGMFYCRHALFEALETTMAEEGGTSLSGGVRRLAREGKVNVCDIGTRQWLDVDNEQALEKAESLVRALAAAQAQAEHPVSAGAAAPGHPAA